MNWILDNLEKLVPVVIALLYFLGSSKTKKAENARQKADPNAEARSRKLQEEIRRKILERQQEGKPIVRSEPVEQPYVGELEFEEEYDPFKPEFDQRREDVVLYPREEESVSAPVSADPEALFEKQRKHIEEQMQKARDLRKQLPSERGKTYSDSSVVGDQQDVGELRMALRDDLRDVNSIRRAIVLKEILDSPLALR